MTFYITFIITILLQTVLSVPYVEPKIIPGKSLPARNLNPKMTASIKTANPSRVSKYQEARPKPGFYVDSFEESSLETHMLVQVPDNLTGVNWPCVVKVVTEFVSCLKTTKFSEKGHTEAITAEDLFVQSGEIFTCIVTAATSLAQCITLTETPPQSQEYKYDSSEEMTYAKKWRIN